MRAVVLLLALVPSSAFSTIRQGSEFGSGTTKTTHEVARTGMKLERRLTSSPSRMNYCNDGMEEFPEAEGGEKTPFSRASTVGRWWKPFTPPPTESCDESSRKVDEYLEFLDKRYHRVHSDETPQPKKTVSAWNWIRQEGDTEHDETSESNALYALGVAGLASERLLQKHSPSRKHSIVEISHSNVSSDSITVDHTSASLLDTMQAHMKGLFALFAAKLLHHHTGLALGRRVLGQAVSRVARDSVKNAVQTLPFATAKLASSVWKAGGGGKTLKLTAATLCAFMIVVAQPLAKGIISTGASTQV
jgi:hypothetical protein